MVTSDSFTCRKMGDGEVGISGDVWHADEIDEGEISSPETDIAEDDERDYDSEETVIDEMEYEQDSDSHETVIGGMDTITDGQERDGVTTWVPSH